MKLVLETRKDDFESPIVGQVLDAVIAELRFLADETEQNVEDEYMFDTEFERAQEAARVPRVRGLVEDLLWVREEFFPDSRPPKILAE